MTQLTAQALHGLVREALCEIAPELDPAGIADDAHVQEDLDLDSMDFLDFVTALSTRLGIEIPEDDYPRLATPAQCVAYLAESRAAAS